MTAADDDVSDDAPPPDLALAALLDGLEAEDRDAVFDPTSSALRLRALIAERRGLASGALVRLAREAEGLRLDRAGALRLALWGGDVSSVGKLASERFGAAPRRVSVPKAEQALAAAKPPPLGPAQVAAVLALDGAWWLRLLAEPSIRVFAALPETAHGVPLALAVAAVETGPTGDDRTLWATDAPGRAAAVEAILGDLGFAADLWAEAGGLKLFALAGYVQAHDERLARAPGRLSGVIGAAPVGFPP